MNLLCMMKIETPCKIKRNDKSVYLFQLKFVETKLLEIINTIQSHSLNTIIILFSDHGCGGEINWKIQK